MFFEKWDVLDENGNSRGKTVLRNKAQLRPGEYHLVVHIWVISSDNRILIQRRSDTKKLMPGEWAATGGAAIAGEDSFTAASRELYEELGISSTKESLKKILRLKRRNSLLDIWLIASDLTVDELSLQESEVAEAKWVSLSELKNMVKTNKFHNYGKEYFERVFEKIENTKGVNL
ncbi:MAG: NUDIX domain-containing protein [Clostridia bacterium]|nr:NUDIX domain-containing protein [Clostridia bacterium]